MKIKKGTVDVITYFNLVDSAAGTPETALTITNIDATYTRAQAAAVKNDLTALAATTTAHTDNKGIEVDATNAPGLYRVDWPDAAFASGADKVILTVTCSGCAPAHLIVELVDYEPADVQAILGALTTSASAGDPGTTTTLTAYLKQIINTLEGSAGIPTFPAAAVAANNVSLAETIRSIDSRLPAALASGNLKADVFAMQNDVISAAAWAQATSDELIARLFASTLPAGNPGEFGNTVTGAAAYAVIAATDTQTLLSRVTAAVYTYWLNLNIGGLVASSAEATSIQNNTRVVRVVPAAFERPDSGSTAFVIELALYDEVGNMEAPDSAPTLAVVNQSLTSRNANLDSTTMTLVSTGRYRSTYTMDTNHAIEQLVFAFSVIEGGNTRIYMNTGQVVDTTAVDFTSTDRTTLNAIASSSSSAASSASTAATQATAAATQTTGAAIRSAIGMAAANLDTQFGLVATAANLATLAGKFTGITLLARWLGALMGKTADAPTLTEIQATQAGAGYNNATDSLEANRDNIGTAGAGLTAVSGGGGGGGTVGPGSIPWTVTVTTTGAVPIGGVEVWVTTDEDGDNTIAGALTTDNFGNVEFMLDAGTYYLWKQRAGVDFTNPQTMMVS